MKILLPILALSLFASLPGYPITIRTSIELGRKSRGCEGAGICEIKTSGGEITAGVSLSEDGTVLTLQADAEFLLGRAGQITGAWFVQEEDYVIPADVCRALGAPFLLKIPAGRYAVTRSGGQLTILFGIQESAPVGMR